MKRNQVEAEMHPDNIRQGMWVRWAEHVAARPWRYLIASVVVLLALAAPALSMRLGQTDAGHALDRVHAAPRLRPARRPASARASTARCSSSPRCPSGGAAALTRSWPTWAPTPTSHAVGTPRFNPAGTTAVIRVLPKSSPQAAGNE